MLFGAFALCAALRASALRSKVLFLVGAASSRGVGGVRLVGNPRLHGLGRTAAGCPQTNTAARALAGGVQDMYTRPNRAVVFVAATSSARSSRARDRTP